MYQDTEFKDRTNTEIEQFLKENNIIIKLTLKSDLEKPDSSEIIIRKNFLSRAERIQEINGDYYNDTDFDLKLKALIFHSSVQKPTFRQIISKNIRYEKARLDNTIRVLHYNTTLEEYEALYFFWLGIYTDTASRKQRLQIAKSTEEAILKRLKKDSSISAIEQALAVIERDIDALNAVKNDFNVNANFETEFHQLNDIQVEINRVSTEISRLTVRRDIINEAKDELLKEYANIDLNQLEEIYKSAQSFIPEIHVKFQQLVSYHNNMLKERVRYITTELPTLETEIAGLNSSLSNHLGKEREIAGKLNKSGAVKELEGIIQKLNVKYEQKGKYEEQLRQWTLSNEKLANIEEELDRINQGIASKDSELEERIKDFNKYFSKISEKLYDEQFIISHDKNERAYQLKISSIGGNLGTGKKKGQIAAFDFAYIQFCDQNELPCLHFILHDQIENIHDNQLNLIAEVANDTNSQFIAPILRDKLPPNINPDKYKVLSLSEDDKLFKI